MAQKVDPSQITYPCWTEGMDVDRVAMIKKTLTGYLKGLPNMYYNTDAGGWCSTDFLTQFLDQDLGANDVLMNAIVALARPECPTFDHTYDNLKSGVGVIRELVDLGLPLEMRDSKGNTFYHRLADAKLHDHSGHWPSEAKEFTYLLLEEGVDPTEKNADGFSPSDLASNHCFSLKEPFLTIEATWMACKRALSEQFNHKADIRGDKPKDVIASQIGDDHGGSNSAVDRFPEPDVP